jgi:hypothetical protein
VWLPWNVTSWNLRFVTESQLTDGMGVTEWMTNPGTHKSRVTKICTVAPNIFRFSVFNLPSPFWCLEYSSGTKIFAKFVHPWTEQQYGSITPNLTARHSTRSSASSIVQLIQSFSTFFS